MYIARKNWKSSDNNAVYYCINKVMRMYQFDLLVRRKNGTEQFHTRF